MGKTIIELFVGVVRLMASGIVDIPLQSRDKVEKYEPRAWNR
jgi:hypothetical protein